MGPSDGAGDFVVEEPEPELYNPTWAEPPVWQPAPQDILLMFQQLDTDQVLPLKWVCPGRRQPQRDLPEQPAGFMSYQEEEEDDKDEEKRAPEPSAFDFDDTASEVSSKVKLTPRTPVSAKAKQKKVARMDHVLNSLKRQQKAEREARKSQGRTLGASPFRGGTPSRMAGSPRLIASTTSPGPGSQPGSPRVPAPTGSPSPRLMGTGEALATKAAPSVAAGRSGGSPPSAADLVTTTTTTSPKPAERPPSAGSGSAGTSSSTAQAGQQESVTQVKSEPGVVDEDTASEKPA
ncbi:PAXIP1-associated glutamate-rich protein 1A-like [Littorina saxatilis]|uniref:Uncharacterized protein n=1 Tax=Littorina saxatilis TaxID=31220 RepID=A0AAN9FYJ3_9CAEN